MFVSYTTDFDFTEETDWWYVIKDSTFDISSLKAKRRYEINKGIQKFEVRQIDPCCYKEEIHGIFIAAYSAYPKKYRPSVEKNVLFEEIKAWKNGVVFGAFLRESGELASVSYLPKAQNDCVDFRMMRSNPIFEKYAVNAAMVNGILCYYDAFLAKGGYICDGSRSINHETAFQDYLEKYFGFRKAYGKLHIIYNPRVKWLFKTLFPLRKMLLKFDGIGLVHKLNSVLRLEEISRKTKNGF